MSYKNDLVGQNFDRLKVLSEVEGKPGYVLCQCSCGTVKEIRKSSLTRNRNPVRSCGCLRTENAKVVFKENYETMRKYGTNFGIIGRTTVNKRNKSGCTGVYHNPKTGYYEVTIGLHGHKKYLGIFTKIQDAIDARKAAEDLYYAPLIAARNADLQHAI